MDQPGPSSSNKIQDEDDSPFYGGMLVDLATYSRMSHPTGPTLYSKIKAEEEAGGFLGMNKDSKMEQPGPSSSNKRKVVKAALSNAMDSDFSNVQFTTHFEKAKIPKKEPTLPHYVSQNVVLVGDVAVGKTSLIYAGVKKETPVLPLASINNNQRLNCTRVVVGNDIVTLNLWEMETFCSDPTDTTQNLYRLFEWSDIILLCFCVERRDSFESVSAMWNQGIDDYSPRKGMNNAIKIVVGLKTDLRQSELYKSVLAFNNDKFVTPEEGREMAEKIGALAYVEASANELEGTEELFQLVARATLYKRKNKKCSIL